MGKARPDELLLLMERDMRSGLDAVRYTAGDTMLISASKVKLTELDALVEQAVAAYLRLIDSVDRILIDLLRQCGGRLPVPTPEEDSSEDDEAAEPEQDTA